MYKKVNLQQDEHVLSSLTGLFEIFDGVQNIYYGDLFLTNKRLYVVSTKLINVEESFWFNGEMRDIEHSALIVGAHIISLYNNKYVIPICIRDAWIVNTKLDNFFKVFKFVLNGTHITKCSMNSYVIKPVDIVM
jgi:hypothetical protein